MSKTTPVRIVYPHEKFHEVVAAEVRRLGSQADLNHLDVSRVLDMSCAFEGLAFTGDISRWDVSGAVDMSRMFASSTFNGNIANWNISQVRELPAIFEDSAFQGDVSQWDTARVTDMRWAFSRSQFNGDLSKWDVQNVQHFDDMFRDSAFSGDTSKWKFANVCNVSFMFYNCPWRGIPGNLKYIAGLEFSAVFNPEVAHEFAEPNFYHWFLALNGHTNMHLDWQMLVALVPACADIGATARATLVLQDWWARGMKAECYKYPFESHLEV